MGIQSELQCASELAEVPQPERFQTWVSAVEHPRQVRVCIRIVDAPEMEQLNSQFRNKRGATNVLAFEYPSDDAADSELGDLVICAPEVMREAHTYDCEPEARFAHMTIHGLLHLLGYTHEAPQEAERMEAMECQLMAQLGYANPYEVRA